MTRRSPSTHLLAASAAIAGALQLAASIDLALASDAALLRAVREGPAVYLLGATLMAIGAGVLAWLRGRSWAARVGFAAPWLLGAVSVLALLGSRAGLAYHGEALLHHFLAALCAATCVALPLAWARDPALGRLRALPALPACVGAGLSLAEHLLQPPAGTPPAGLLGQVGTASLLLAPPLALACLWPRLQPPRLRAYAAVLMLPLAVRVGLGGREALMGLPLGTDAAPAIVATLGVAGVLALVLLRPLPERGLRGAALGLAALSAYTLHRTYALRFGDLENALGGLARSLLGFELPYPGYVADWRMSAAMAVLLVLFGVMCAALVSRRDHVRGLALTSLLVAGLGLSSPQLALMCGAALLVSLDTLAGAPAPRARTSPPPRPVDAIAADAAALLGLPAPVILEQEIGTVVSLRGELGRVPVELRARHERGGWAVLLQAGVLGRGAPELELVPGPAGDDDEVHPRAQEHRVRGDARRLERAPEELLLALAPFPDHRTRLWASGCQVELGARLAALETATLADLLKGMSRAT